jgi:hypothetical protein
MLDAGVGDLAPWQTPGSELQLPGGESYVSNIYLYDSSYGDTSGGSINIAIQTPTDSDNNRYPDFFEVSKAVNAVMPNGMMDIWGYGRVYNVSASWTRAAGSRTGNCRIRVEDGYWGTFQHTFEIMEYTGTLSYTPALNTVSGTLALTQTGNAANTFQASVQFLKTGPNELMLQPGLSSGTPLSTLYSFTNHLFTRDIAWPTNYAGYIEFSDGDPYTFEPYANWVLSIDDSNDSDRDGIPDFTDDPVVLPPPRRAQLSLARGAGNLQLTIRGDVGREYELQRTASLATPDWQTAQTVTLSTDPQTISLPATAGFWRAVGH